MKDKNRIKMKIRFGSVVMSKVRDMGDNTGELRIISMSKYVVVCVQAVVGNKKFVVKF